MRVVAGGDQQPSGDVGADTEQRVQRGVDLGDQRGDQRVEVVDLGRQPLVAPREGAQRDQGGGGRLGCLSAANLREDGRVTVG
jgi:hypothetical protein